MNIFTQMILGAMIGNLLADLIGYVFRKIRNEKLIRCKDCKWYEHESCAWFDGCDTTKDGFCHNAERKEQ